MPYLRFIGTYNGEETITMGQYVFEGREATEVDETTDMGRRLMGNPDFSADALDHDGNGKKGGSTSPAEDVSELRKAYKDKFGKRPFNGWDAAELKARIEA